MSQRRLRNSIDENTQTSFSTSSESDSGQHWTEKYFDTMSDLEDNDSVTGNNDINDDETPGGSQDDEAVMTARRAVEQASGVLTAMPAAPEVAPEADATARCMGTKPVAVRPSKA